MTFDSAGFKSSLIYESQASSQDVVTAVESIREIDKANEPQQKLWGAVTIVALIAAVVVLIVGLANNLGTFGLVFAGFLGIFGVVAGFKWRAHKRLNFVDKRYELLAAMTRLLSRDIASDGTLNVRLDVTKPDQAHKFTHKGKAGTWNVKYYDDAWLSMSGKLLDGTGFQLVVSERFQQRSKWKRSSSGKMKHKTKTKSGTAATLRLKPKASKYVDLAKVNDDASQAIQLPYWVDSKGLQQNEGTFVLKTATRAEWEIPVKGGPAEEFNGTEMIAAMFLSLYQILNLSKAITKAGRQE